MGIPWASHPMDRGKESDAEVDQRTKALKPGQCAVLVYTSGTTGDPKAWTYTEMVDEWMKTQEFNWLVDR